MKKKILVDVKRDKNVSLNIVFVILDHLLFLALVREFSVLGITTAVHDDSKS